MAKKPLQIDLSTKTAFWIRFSPRVLPVLVRIRNVELYFDINFSLCSDN